MISPTLLAILADEASPGGPVDGTARVLSILGIVLSAIALARLFLEAWRKRASNVPDDLQEIVKTMLNDLSGALQRPERITQLNTPVAGAKIERLAEIGRRVSDWMLARKIKRFHSDVGSARVMSTDAEFTLTHEQMEKLQQAIKSAKKVLKRLDHLSKIAPG